MLVTLAGLASSSARAQSPLERCREATLHAPRAAAIAACDGAVVQGGGAQALWAAAHVRVARPETPSMDDLIRADLLAAGAARLEPAQPWGALARFELARRWGDPELTTKQLAELERLAPGRDVTLQAAASVKPPLPWARLVAWTLLLALVAVTLADALRRRGMPARARLSTPLVLALAAATLLAPARASAAFAIDDAAPERNVPTQADANGNPMEFAYYLQNLSERIAQAEKRGDQLASIRYLRALARAVPDSILPQRKLCAALTARGERDAALPACRAALGLSDVRAEDFVRFGDLVLQAAQPSASDVADAVAAARHLAAQPDARVLGLQLECRIAVKTRDLPLLEECSHGLADAAAPHDPSTWVFAWTLASERGQPDEARRDAEKARAAGLPAEAVARLLRAPHGRAVPAPFLFAGAGLLVFGLGSLAWRRHRRVTV